MKALLDFRTTRTTSYAPSPLSAGLCLIGLGISLIAGHVYRSPRRLFYQVQARLVWSWFCQRNYTRATAGLAWFLTLLTVTAYILIAYGCCYLNWP